MFQHALKTSLLMALVSFLFSINTLALEDSSADTLERTIGDESYKCQLKEKQVTCESYTHGYRSYTGYPLSGHNPQKVYWKYPGTLIICIDDIDENAQHLEKCNFAGRGDGGIVNFKEENKNVFNACKINLNLSALGPECDGYASCWFRDKWNIRYVQKFDMGEMAQSLGITHDNNSPFSLKVDRREWFEFDNNGKLISTHMTSSLRAAIPADPRVPQYDFHATQGFYKIENHVEGSEVPWSGERLKKEIFPWIQCKQTPNIHLVLLNQRNTYILQNSRIYDEDWTVHELLKYELDMNQTKYGDNGSLGKAITFTDAIGKNSVQIALPAKYERSAMDRSTAFRYLTKSLKTYNEFQVIYNPEFNNMRIYDRNWNSIRNTEASDLSKSRALFTLNGAKYSCVKLDCYKIY